MILFFIDQLDSGTFIGNLFGLSSGLSFAGFIVIASRQKGGSGIGPIIYGSLFTFLIGLPFYTPSLIEPSSLFGIILLGLFQVGLSYILYTKSMEYLGPIDGILIPVLEPILNPIWVIIMIGEIPSLYAIIGGI